MPIAAVDAVHLAQQGRPGQWADVVPEAPSLLGRLLRNALVCMVQLDTAAERANLGRAGALESINPHEGLRTGASDRKRTVIAQDHPVLVCADVPDKPLALIEIEGHPF